MSKNIKLSREKFRYSIRRQQLEKEFKKKRFTSLLDINELFYQFEQTSNQDELINLIEEILTQLEKNKERLKIIFISSRKYLEIWINKILELQEWNEIITISLINLSYFFDLSLSFLQKDVISQLNHFIEILKIEKGICLKQSLIFMTNVIIDENATLYIFRNNELKQQFETFLSKCLQYSNEESEEQLCEFLSILGSSLFAPYSMIQNIFKYSVNEIKKRNTNKHFNVLNATINRQNLDFNSLFFMETIVSCSLVEYLKEILQKNNEDSPFPVNEILELLTKLFQYEYPDNFLDYFFEKSFLKVICELAKQNYQRDSKVLAILLIKELTQYPFKQQMQLVSTEILSYFLSILDCEDILIQECILKCFKASFKTSKYLTGTLISLEAIQTITKIFLKTNQDSVKLYCLKCIFNILDHKDEDYDIRPILIKEGVFQQLQKDYQQGEINSFADLIVEYFYD